MDDAFRFSTDALWWLPEQHRTNAELLLLELVDEAEAEAAFRRVLDVARTHGNRASELRAAIGLARLLHRQGRSAEARDLLAEPYASFTEGFHLPHLRKTQELLEDLSISTRRSAGKPAPRRQK